MKRYKAIIVKRTYQTIIYDLDEDFDYSMEDVKRMILDEFDPIAHNSESETEIYDLAEVV